MERMTGLDASMLYTETANAHMHTMKVAVLDVRAEDGPLDRQRLIDELQRRLHLLPPLRRRPVPVPLHLHHPIWVEDPAFTIDRHVGEVCLAPPGGRRELDHLLGQIHAQPLARDRPLWQVTLISGLADGHIAVAVKVHHAVADGVAAAAGLASLAATGPGEPIPPPVQPWSPEPLPHSWPLVRDAIVDRARQLRALPGLMARTVSGLVRMTRARRRLEHRPPAALSGPRAPWNGPLTPRRVVATTRLPLHDFKLVKSAVACSLNDVVLAVAAGGLRRYAQRHGQAPIEPLICSVPTSTDPGGGPPRLWGNRVSQFFTSLCTDIDDPEQRLRAISSVTKNAKLLNSELGPELMEQWNEFAGPIPYRLLWGQIMRRVKTPAVNVVVSTVPGPREEVWFARSRMEEFYSLSVLTEGAGLNLTVWSYRGGMYLGLVSCPELTGDVEAMVDDLREALGELVKLAEA